MYCHPFSYWWGGLVAWFLIACGTTFGGPPPAMVTNCGQVNDGVHLSGPASATGCFYQAYIHCQQATLTYRYTPLDTIELQTFRVQPDCSVTDARQFSILPGNPATKPATVYQCQGVRWNPTNIVILGCGAKGDVTIRTP